MTKWIYRLLFKAALDRLELILFIDRENRAGHGWSEDAAKREMDLRR